MMQPYRKAHAGKRADRRRFAMSGSAAKHYPSARTCTVVCFALALAGCGYRPAVPPSEGHLSADRIVPKVAEGAPPPVTSSSFVVPPPQPTVRPPTYSVVVSDV